MKKRKEKYVREFVKNIDEDYNIIFEDTFEVDVYDEEITATFKQDPELDKMYYDFVKKEFETDCENIFLLSLLHEIGHIETYEEELEIDRDFRYGLLKLKFEDDEDVAEYNNMYFRIPAEYEATAWGVNYYNTHKELCEELIRKIR